MSARPPEPILTAAVPQLQDFLAATARRRPDAIALVCDGRRMTYAEMDAESTALAHALVRLGVRRGDRVVVFADNTVQSVVSFWAILKASAVSAIVNSQTRSDRLAYLLADCGASALVTDARHTATFIDPAARATSLRAVVVSGDADASRIGHLPGLTHWDDALAAPPGGSPPERRGLDVDLAAIVYSSGSTGDPKGIALTHRNMITAATSISTYLENTERDVILGVLPLSLTYGLYQLITAVRVGARLVLERSFAFPAQILKVMAEERVTGFAGVPMMYAMMLQMKTLADYDLSGLRYLTNAAAAIPEEHLLRLQDLLPNARIYSMYGQTECARISYLPPEDVRRKPGSIGIAIPNTEIWIVDERGERLGPNEVGELVVRGGHVMRGYWERPELTAARLRPGPLPGEQVLFTGDLHRFDDEGYLYFVSRMDDIIKTRGEKVAPKEVEHALSGIPGVREAAVIGVPDPILGQAIKAFLVLEPDADVDPKSARLECEKRLENYKVPKEIVIVPELPRTSGGKVRKTELR